MPDLLKRGVIGSGCIDIPRDRLSAYRAEIERPGRAEFEVQLSGNAGNGWASD